MNCFIEFVVEKDGSTVKMAVNVNQIVWFNEDEDGHAVLHLSSDPSEGLHTDLWYSELYGRLKVPNPGGGRSFYS